MCGGGMQGGMSGGFGRNMSSFQPRNMGFQGFQGSQGPQSWNTGAFGPQSSGYHPYQPPMPKPMMQGQPVGSPPSAFGKGFVPPQTDGPLTSSNVWRGPPPQGMPQTGGRQAWNEPVGSPPSAFGKGFMPQPAQQPAFDPYKQFAMGRPGEIPGVSGGGMFGSQPGAGMTGMQNPGPGGAPQAPSGMGGQREAMTDLFAQQANGQPKAAPAGPMWDGFSQQRLSTPSGSMGIDPAMMQQLGFNGLRASLTQDMGAGNPMSEAAKFWVSQGGKNLGSLDMLGRTNGLDLRNLGPGATINWSGLGPQGATLMGNGRRY